MPQFQITYMKRGNFKPQTKTLLADRLSDIFKQLFEIEKAHTIVAIENKELTDD